MAFPKKTILKSFVWLSLLGLALSLYLSYTHFAPPTEGSFCDFTENISCSLVNTSIYSELFHVPVALFGALWFFVLLMLTWNAFSAKYAPVFVRALFAWSLPGFLFILYMIYAEIQLEAICPLCTLSAHEAREKAFEKRACQISEALGHFYCDTVFSSNHHL